MKRKIIGVILAIAMGLICLAGCKYVDLTSGATVHLTVTSETQNYEVVSSYGEVTGSGGKFDVTVPDKRDFLISVSAEGYATCTIPVTVKDIADGSCEKSAVFGEHIKRELTVNVSGVTANVTVTCGNTPLTGSRTRFKGEFTGEELAKGLSVSADGAEPRTVKLTEAQCAQAFLSVNVYLVAKGYKLYTLFYDTGSPCYAYDAASNVWFSEVVSETGSQNSYTHFFNLPVSFRGTLTIGSEYNTPVNVNVTSDEPYGEDNVFDLMRNTGSYFTNYYTKINSEHYPNPFDSSASNNLYLYAETQYRIVQTYFSLDWDNPYYYIYLSDTKADEEIVALHVLQNWGGERSWKRIPWKENLSESDIDLTVFDDESPFAEITKGYIEDGDFGGPYCGTDFYRNDYSLEYGSQEVRVPITADGTFDLNDSFDEFQQWKYHIGSSDEGETIGLETDYRMACIRVGDEWAKGFRIHEHYDYRVKVTDEQGAPLTGADVVCNAEPMTEEGGGYYRINIRNLPNYSSVSSYTLFVRAEKNGKIRYGEIPLNEISEGAVWTADRVGRTKTAEMENLPSCRILFEVRFGDLSYSGNFGDWSFTVSYTQGGVTKQGEATALTGKSSWSYKGICAFDGVDEDTEITITVGYTVTNYSMTGVVRDKHSHVFTLTLARMLGLEEETEEPGEEPGYGRPQLPEFEQYGNAVTLYLLSDNQVYD